MSLLIPIHWFHSRVDHLWPVGPFEVATKWTFMIGCDFQSTMGLLFSPAVSYTSSNTQYFIVKQMKKCKKYSDRPTNWFSVEATVNKNIGSLS